MPLLRRFLLAAALVPLSAVPAAAQVAAADLYERTLGREEAAVAAEAPLATLRSIATSYENLVRRFPRSGYADNALWNAARVLRLAHSRFNQPADRDKAAALIGWLRREYPHSSLARADLAEPSPPASAVASVEPDNGSAAPATAAAASPPVAPPAGSPAPLPPEGGAAVRAISYSSLPRGDRITIELSREVPYTAERLADPDRVYVDLAGAFTAPELVEQAGAAITGRLIKRTRLGVHPNGTSRVVLDVTGRPRYSTFPLYNPFRLVIDVESDTLTGPAAPAVHVGAPASTPPAPTSRVPGGAAPAAVSTATAPPSVPAVTGAAASRPVAGSPATPAPPPPAAPSATSRGEYSLARQLGLQVSRVVIDAGHGGHDPGARANGLTEAELVLDVALRLEELLREEGLDVVLTRRTDVFVPLEERTAIANRHQADLFVSIHANASPRPATNGVETYFLNFASNQQAEAVAARENASSAKTMANLPQLLRAIALNNKLAESRELAGMVQTALVRSLSAKRRSVQSLGVKQAPFVVLIGAQMPSILAEIGFITNRNEAAALKQAAGRQAVAQGLFDAIVKYQGALKTNQAVARRQEGR